MTPVNNVLLKHLDENLIETQSDISSQKKLLQLISDLLSTNLDNCSQKTINQLLLNREKMGSTCIGNGVAIPHSRCEHVDQPVIAIVSLASPVEYDDINKQFVNLVFGLLVPSQANDEHLQLLSNIASLASQQNLVEQLSAADSPSALLTILKTHLVK